MAVLTMVVVCGVAVRGEDPVYFADENLKQAVIDELAGVGVVTTDPTPTDMLLLGGLGARWSGIASLTGLEYAINLSGLFLSVNQISDLSPLRGLTNLRTLGLSDNQISDPSPLAGLDHLSHVVLNRNQISDVSALGGLTDLGYLELDDNQISDVSSLAGMHGLTGLQLHDNQISDISPLVGLTNLLALGLSGNPLNHEACTIYIPQMQANGVDVEYGGCAFVPNVVGMTESEAEAALAAAGFAVGRKAWGPSDLPPGTVYDQFPAGGQTTQRGSAVDLILSQDDGGGGGGEPGSGPATRLPRALAHWKLDESSGRIAHDSSVNGHDGTLYGNPIWMPAGGMLDGALAFDGLGDYVRIGDHRDFDVTSEITLAAWVNTHDAGNNQNNPYVAKGDHSYALKYTPKQGGHLEFFIFDGTWRAVWLPVDGTFNGTWHHLAGSYDGSWLKLYVDGLLAASAPHQGGIAASSWDLNIGRNSERTDRFYHGLIDDVRIYDVALSQDQIVAVMESQVAAEPPAGMIAYWPGDGHARDIAGGHDGTLDQGATFAPGVMGQAFAFDGVDDRVHIPYSPELYPPSVTVEAWIKPNDIRWMKIVDTGGVYLLSIEGEGKLFGMIAPSSLGGSRYSLRGGSIPAGQWSHVAATYDALAGRWILYVNGWEVAAKDLEDNNPLISRDASAPDAWDVTTSIGSYRYYGGGHFFDGLIDEVAIYNRALTAQEILLIYQGLAE